LELLDWSGNGAFPEVLGRGTRLGAARAGRARVSLFEEAVEVCALDAYPSADVDGWELARVDPLSGLPDYADQARGARAASGGAALGVRVIEAF